MDQKGETVSASSSSPYRLRVRPGTGTGTGTGSRPAPQRGCIVQSDVGASSSSRSAGFQSAPGATILESSELVESPTPLAFAPPPGASFSAPTLGQTARRRMGRPPKLKDGPGGSGSSSAPTRTRRLGGPPKYGHGGGLLSGSAAGPGITIHVVVVNAAEDIVAKILAVAQQLQRVVRVLSVNGSVSIVTLSLPATSGSGGNVTCEGPFEILCLSRCCLPTRDGGSWNQIGALSISFSRSDGSVSGGRVGGRLIAASRVQVILGTFDWNNQEGQEVGTSSGHKRYPKIQQHQSQAH